VEVVGATGPVGAVEGSAMLNEPSMLVMLVMSFANWRWVRIAILLSLRSSRSSANRDSLGL